MVWLVQINVCNSSNPPELPGATVLCPGPAVDPLHTHAPLTTNPGTAPGNKEVRLYYKSYIYLRYS